MLPPRIRVRRATLEDMPQLLDLWTLMGFPAAELARKVTEFQVAETEAGSIVGAIGLRLSGRHGFIHSEGFTDFGLADLVRPQFWERLQALAHNHGLVRLWTLEQAPFWVHCELSTPDTETLAKLPSEWRDRRGAWLTLRLKEELEAVLSADKEFALFMESEKQRTHRALQQARILKTVATLLALALFGSVLAGLFIVIRNNPSFLGR